MKQEEEKLSRLFQQLKEDDERQTPSFAHAWNTALSRQEKGKNPWRIWQLAIGSALLIALCVGGARWWMHTRQHEQQTARFSGYSTYLEDQPADLEDKPVDKSNPAPRISIAPVPVKHSRNIARPQRRFISSQPTPILLSQWRSPTESLLQIPGGQLFTRLPRLDESSVSVKATAPQPVN